MSMTTSETPSDDNQPQAETASIWDDLSKKHGDDYLASWLQLQSSFIPGSYSALLAVAKNGGNFKPVAVWPDTPSDVEQLSELIDNVISFEKGLVTALERGSKDGVKAYGVGYPIVVNETLSAVVAVAIVVRDESGMQFAMKQLQWGVSWFELSKLRSENTEQTVLNKKLSAGVDTLANVLGEQEFNSACMRFVSDMSIALDCERVSLGFMHNSALKLRHLSDSVQFGEKMNLVKGIEAAMNEAADQHLMIVYPPLETDDLVIVNRAHETLSQDQTECSVISIPLYIDDQCVAAVTLERELSHPFTKEESEFSESVASLVVAVLEEKRLNNRSIFVKMANSVGSGLSNIFGAGHIGKKLGVIALVVVASFLSFASGDYRLSSNARLETSLQQVVASPFDAYIKSSLVRAGDVVSKGDVLVDLDDRDLRLERLKTISQKAKLERQYQEATANYDRARIKILSAEISRLDAELNLVERRLEHASLLSPFDGLLISGDLSQRMGSAVNKGEELFQVSPLNKYRIKLLVKESRIADIELGQTGTLFLSALPENNYSFVVNRITPVITVLDGASYFNVEADLNETSDQLQPGMEGVGKIFVDERKYFDIWTRDFVEWFRIKAWSWWG